MRRVAQTAPRRARVVKAEETRQRILDAARREFGLHGFQGARVEAIARRARVTKGNVFYHFRNKEELFRVLTEQRIANVRAADPADPGELGFQWTLRMFETREESVDWARYHLWEGLNFDSDPSFEIPMEDLRASNFQRRVSQVQRSQAAGLLPTELDPRQLTFFLLAVGTYPYLLPQMAHLITGHRTSNDDFRREFVAFLQQLAGLLRGNR
jgi:AcrR family transcriptional regulator